MRERVFCRRASALPISGWEYVCLCRGREGWDAGAPDPAEEGGPVIALFLFREGDEGATGMPLLGREVSCFAITLRSRLSTRSAQGLIAPFPEVEPLPTASDMTLSHPSLSAALSA